MKFTTEQPIQFVSYRPGMYVPINFKYKQSEETYAAYLNGAWRISMTHVDDALLHVDDACG